MKRVIRVFPGCLVFLLAFGAPLFGAPADTRGQAVAEVNGMKLSETDLTGVMNELMPREFFHTTVDPEKVAKVKKKALEELITRELYYQEGKKTIRVGKSEIGKVFDDIKGKFKSKDEFKKALKGSGISEEELKEAIEKKLVREKFYDREVTKKAGASDEFLRDYYEKNRSSYFRPEGVRLRHIVIKVPPESTREERQEFKKKAEEVLKKAKAGEDFAQLAWDNSTDEYRVKGGDIGVMHKGMLLPELEEAAFKLKTGQVSGIIETIYGYHIVKVEEKLPPAQMSFEEVKGKLRRQFEKERTEELEEALIKNLKGKAEIKIYMKE